jgi:hypothetical protein
MCCSEMPFCHQKGKWRNYFLKAFCPHSICRLSPVIFNWALARNVFFLISVGVFFPFPFLSQLFSRTACFSCCSVLFISRAKFLVLLLFLINLFGRWNETAECWNIRLFFVCSMQGCPCYTLCLYSSLFFIFANFKIPYHAFKFLLCYDDDDDGRFLACEDCGKVRVLVRNT